MTVRDDGGWRSLGEIPGATSAESIALLGNDVLVATDIGLFRRPLEGAATWAAAGLQGSPVRVVRVQPGLPQTVWAGLEGVPEPMRLSTDGALTWQSRGGQAFFDPSSGMWDPVFDFAFPGGTTVYASLAATSVARSSDLGQTWTYVQGAPGGFGYSCYIGADGPTILQGCESPLDSAWLARLTPTTTGVDRSEVLDSATLANRRPNCVVTHPAYPSRVWVGFEGALALLEGGVPRFLWKTELDAAGGDYAYVRGVWVDPADPRHLVFGGLSKDETFPLFETFDEGASRARLAPPAGVDPGPGFNLWALTAFAQGGSQGRTLVVGATVGDANQGATRAVVLVREIR